MGKKDRQADEAFAWSSFYADVMMFLSRANLGITARPYNEVRNLYDAGYGSYQAAQKILENYNANR